MSAEETRPKSYALLVFPGFEALDAIGPMEVVNTLSLGHEITLSVIAATLDPVSTLFPGKHRVGQSITPTHTFTDHPALDVLIIPGGFGAEQPGDAVIDFVRRAGAATPHLITVCNGATIAARAGLLDGKRATSNKAYWKDCVASSAKVNWVAQARWVRDGDAWTSSGVSAGIDATLAFVEEYFGDKEATEIANQMEFIRAKSADDDPFAALYKCEDAPATE